MKATKETMGEIERLYSEYEYEVYAAYNAKKLQLNTVNTYLPHAERFVRWCKGEFEPGCKSN